MDAAKKQQEKAELPTMEYLVSVNYESMNDSMARVITHNVSPETKTAVLAYLETFGIQPYLVSIFPTHALVLMSLTPASYDDLHGDIGHHFQYHSDSYLPDEDRLMDVFQTPAGHWISLRPSSLVAVPTLVLATKGETNEPDLTLLATMHTKAPFDK